MAGKFGLEPRQLEDAELERELRQLYATREETFFHGSRQALLNHTERMLQLEREYAHRFPERTRLMRCGPARAPGARLGSRLAGNQLPVSAGWSSRRTFVAFEFAGGLQGVPSRLGHVHAYQTISSRRALSAMLKNQ